MIHNRTYTRLFYSIKKSENLENPSEDYIILYQTTFKTMSSNSIALLHYFMAINSISLIFFTSSRIVSEFGHGDFFSFSRFSVLFLHFFLLFLPKPFPNFKAVQLCLSIFGHIVLLLLFLRLSHLIFSYYFIFIYFFP